MQDQLDRCLISTFLFASRLDSIEVSINQMRAELDKLRAQYEAEAKWDEDDYDDETLDSERGELEELREKYYELEDLLEQKKEKNRELKQKLANLAKQK